MVNASLNWASIVGIVLAVCGAGLYFMRSFKPALARDYDVFFAAIGLLCGGILFFQGWRLDPILQFGQFLLAGTTVFFAYESVRLRGIAADQARRSSYFDDEVQPPSTPPRRSKSRIGDDWEDSYDQFDENRPLRRRFAPQENLNSDRSEDLYRPRRISRAVIPEEAESRRINPRIPQNSWDEESSQSRRISRFSREEEEGENRSSFGERRTQRQGQRRGSRPRPSGSQQEQMNKRRMENDNDSGSFGRRKGNYSISGRNSANQNGNVVRSQPEDAAFSPITSRNSSPETGSSRPSARRRPEASTKDNSTYSSEYRRRPTPPRSSRPRDNSSQFDD